MKTESDKIPERVKESLKKTVGYAEAKSKGSFIVGANVAFSKSEEFYLPQIESLRQQVENYKTAYERTVKEISTISSILKNYE